jgi:hypothetical protein
METALKPPQNTYKVAIVHSDDQYGGSLTNIYSLPFSFPLCQ